MSQSEYYTKIIVVGKDVWRVSVFTDLYDLEIERYFVHKDDKEYVVCMYYNYGDEIARVATLHQTRTAALSHFRANLSQIESEIAEERKRPDADDTYTDFATGHVLPINTITVEISMHEELDAFSVDLYASESSIDFKPKTGFSQLVLFRNTNEYMCLPIYIWTDNRVLADNQVSLESLRRAFGRIEVYLQTIGEPTAEPDVYLTENEIVAYSADDANAPDASEDLFHFKVPFDHDVREAMLRYVDLGSWVHWSGDRSIGSDEMVGTTIYDLETSKKLARLHDTKASGSVLAIAHSIFRDWCDENDRNMDDFHHCPFITHRVE